MGLLGIFAVSRICCFTNGAKTDSNYQDHFSPRVIFVLLFAKKQKAAITNYVTSH